MSQAWGKAWREEMSISLNHILLRAGNIQVMSQFLIQTLGLTNGFRPPFDFPGIWLYSEDQPLIHIVEMAAKNDGLSDYLGEQKTISGAMGVIDHVALTGTHYFELLSRLKQQQIQYYERTVPLSNEHQVFVEGPDNLRLELLFNADKSSINKSM